MNTFSVRLQDTLEDFISVPGIIYQRHGRTFIQNTVLDDGRIAPLHECPAYVRKALGFKTEDIRQGVVL